MSYAIATPEIRAADLAAIGSTFDEAHPAGAPMTLAPIPAAADDVSARIAHLFFRNTHSNISRRPGGGGIPQQSEASAGAYAGVEGAIVWLSEASDGGVKAVGTVAGTPSLYAFGLRLKGLAKSDPTGLWRL